MEAMWMRFQPAFLEVERRVAAGQIGEPVLAQADFGIAAHADPARRWFARAQGGGALLDVGIYPLTFVRSILGDPTEARALGELAATGVDASVSVAMRHGGEAVVLVVLVRGRHGVEATVAGPEGSIRVHGPFHSAGTADVAPPGRGRRGARLEDAHLGYRLEVAEVHRCLDGGRDGVAAHAARPHAVDDAVARRAPPAGRVTYPHEEA
jgi:predicted dehydrogenase